MAQICENYVVNKSTLTEMQVRYVENWENEPEENGNHFHTKLKCIYAS